MKEKDTHIANKLFKQFLKERGLSFTRQRKVILEQIFRDHDHFEAEEIVGALRNRKIRVSRATVYRTLSCLENCNLIRRIDLGHGHSHFEHTLGHTHHEHLYCKKCGKIIEFTDAALEERIGTISKLNHFVVLTHTVQIFGLCKDCNIKLKKR